MTTTRKLCYPHPLGAASHVLMYGNKPGLHPTAGLAHNWALDFMTAGGTLILAVEAGTIWRLSGHNPNEGVIDGDIYGWNTYLHTRDGLMYFYTHQGSRNVHVGDRVKKGQVIGAVGLWPGDPGRSHTHLGVTHPMGERASKRAILNVAEAPHVQGTYPKEAA
jgi:murein DD-endopeptidase MepM/ murein hydrolase activator NlpD